MAGKPTSSIVRTDALRPRWLWIAFAVFALAVPVVGLVIENLR